MDCAEQKNELLKKLAQTLGIGLGGFAIGILNHHPEIQGTDIIPGTNATLKDFANKYQQAGSQMAKETLLNNLEKHDKGELITVAPQEQTLADMFEKTLQQYGDCKDVQFLTRPLNTPSVTVASLSVAPSKLA